MKHFKYLSFLSFVFLFITFSSCESESKAFIGEWQDAREPLNKWSISKKGSVFIGNRVSGDDFYKYDTEEWHYELGQGEFPTLTPVKEGGSTLIFQAKENRILRNPPGRAYVKVKKEK